MQTQRAVLNPSQLETFIQRFGSHQLRLRQDIYSLLQTTPTLIPTQDTFIANDGSSHLMLLLDGTIPISFRGSLYHIPVNIWISDQYPLAPPVPYVVPTKGMIIKNRHQCVDPTGLCFIPYLSQWRPEMSHLVGLVYSMGVIFSNEPPVYSKPPDSTPQPPPTASPTHIHPPSSPPPISTHPVQIPNQSLSPQKEPPTSPKLSPQVNQSSVVNGRNGLYSSGQTTADRKKMVEDKLFAEFAKLYSHTKEEVEKFSRTRSQLEKNDEILQNAVYNLELDKQQMDDNIAILYTKENEADEWLAKFEKVVVNVDETIAPEDPLSQQMLDLVAEDAAIEDTLYYLNRAFEGDSIDFETFGKVYRSLSREQFMKRAACKKVFEAQHAQLLNSGQTLLRSSW